MDNGAQFSIYIFGAIIFLIILLMTFLLFKEDLKSFRSQKNIYKILLAIAFLLCLSKMPYWYYQLIRMMGMIAFIYFAYLDNKDKIKITPQIFSIAAIIINPIIKISFDKETWQNIDIILSIVLFLSILFERRLNTKIKEQEDNGNNKDE
jgi:bacteriorhodopsin